MIKYTDYESECLKLHTVGEKFNIDKEVIEKIESDYMYDQPSFFYGWDMDDIIDFIESPYLECEEDENFTKELGSEIYKVNTTFMDEELIYKIYTDLKVFDMDDTIENKIIDRNCGMTYEKHRDVVMDEFINEIALQYPKETKVIVESELSLERTLSIF